MCQCNFIDGLPTFYGLHPLRQVSLGTVGVLNPPGVAVPAVENAVARVAVPEVAEPVVDVVAVVGVEPGVVFVALVSVADVSEPQASVDTVLAFVFLVPVSEVAVEVYSPGRPRIFAFPNIDYYSSPSSSVEAVG